jgi:tetratricopeptide (TPR) repeat protein
VGREEELQLLLNRWERARAGEGQLALVIGEAGIGKSRLVAEFHERIRDTPHIWMESAGEQLFENTPFHAFSQMLAQWLELQAPGGAQRSRAASGAKRNEQTSLRGAHNEDESARFASETEQLDRLERALASAGLKADEAAPLVADFLQLPVGDRYRGVTFTPEQKRRRLLALLTGWTLGAARLQPMVMLIEDLHWLDPSTLELQQLMAEQGAIAPLMLLYTARPEFRQQWPLRSQHTQITLNWLSGGDVQKMIAELAALHALARETLDAVVQRTSGVPLFVEELTRAVLESGDARAGGRGIPETLHDSLMARLDRLGTAKEVAQLAAVIGPEFSYELLEAVSSSQAGELQAALAKLADAELIYPRGVPPDATYQFKHALIRDTAYEALLKSRRRELHRLVAQTIAQKFTAVADMQPEVLAHHWTEAGETELAISQWTRAGKAAEEHNAFHEAQESYQQALALLNRLPESADRDARELQFRHSLVSMLHVTHGWAAPETVAAAERVEILAKRSGNLGQLVASLTTRCFHAYIAGELPLAAALADQALELALREGDPSALATLYMMQVFIHHQRGDLAGSEQHYTTGLEFFKDSGFLQNPNGGAIAVFGQASFSTWMLGRADVARERVAKMMSLVNPANPHDQPWAEFFAAGLCSLMRTDEETAALARRVIEACEKYKFPNEAAWGRSFLGIAQAHLGHTSEGVALIREGIAGLLKVGGRIGVVAQINNLAEAQHLDGAITEALVTVEQALEFNPEGTSEPA